MIIMPLLILVCERCAESFAASAGVYRDDIGQVLCEDCDNQRIRDRYRVSGDYGRQVETEPRAYKRNGLWRGVA